MPLPAVSGAHTRDLAKRSPDYGEFHRVTAAGLRSRASRPGGIPLMMKAPLLGCTASIVTVQSAVLLCELTASPWSIGPETLRVTVEPGTSVHVAPSADVYAVNVVPLRSTLRYAGTVPDTVSIRLSCPPCAVRSWTTMPSPGVTSSE